MSNNLEDSHSGWYTNGGKPRTYIGSPTGVEMFGEFRIGKGLVLLCQPDFDESEVALSEHVLAHLAVQLLSPPGQLLLEAESSR